MNDTELPPLPPAGAIGSAICATMRLYISVLRDLPPEQVRVVLVHVQGCKTCSLEYQLASRTTQMVASLDSSVPSSHVDKAVMAAIAARKRHTGPVRLSEPARPLVLATAKPPRRRKLPVRLAGLVAAAAVLLVAALLSAHLLLPGSTAFALPANLSWNGYVLHHTQTVMSAGGEQYQIDAYHDMATDRMNVTTKMDGKMEVVVVQDENGKKMLGKDMMNNVAQWQPPDSWSVDDSMFDADALRGDLQAKRAVYQGIDAFKGQQVYRIGWSNGTALLLNMQYEPVNVLKDAKGPGTGTPVYDTIQLLQPSQVSDSIWDMSVPKNFKMGKLPPKP
ncbi:MAG TPA: hypothetical protein VKR06_09380 [Ktedonosporobacter sp.]|nr:hypothetical protein [Ktedonosporobacter sp.]